MLIKVTIDKSLTRTSADLQAAVAHEVEVALIRIMQEAGA